MPDKRLGVGGRSYFALDRGGNRREVGDSEKTGKTERKYFVLKSCKNSGCPVDS